MKKYLIYLLASFMSFSYAMDNKLSCISSSAAVMTFTYTKHALNQMKERNITESQVENVVNTGKKSEQADGITLFFGEKNNKVNQFVVVLAMTPKGPIVKTVYRKEPPLPLSSAVVMPLIYTDCARDAMKKENITESQIENVVKTGTRSELAQDKTEFVEKKNKVNPLTVILVITAKGSTVITVFKQTPHAGAPSGFNQAHHKGIMKTRRN